MNTPDGLPLVFPKENVNVIGYPSSLRKLADLEVSILWLCDTIPLKKLPSGTIRPVWMQYETIRRFRTLCFDFCKEFSDNIESGVSLKYAETYNRCYENLKECLRTFEVNVDLLAFDMSAIPSLESSIDSEKGKNWYRLIYETLKLYEGEIAKLLSKIANKEAPKPLSGRETLLKGLKQVALFYFYSKQRLDTRNANAIADEYKLNSGKKLKEQYNRCLKQANRTECSASNVKNLATVLSELERLNFPAQEAKDDLQKASRVTEE